MKVCLFCVLFLLLGTGLLAFGPSIPDVAFHQDDDHMAIAAASRMLKVNFVKPKVNRYHPKWTDVHLEDYHTIDPAPSSKASIKPGPIQHGTPLNPYIPRPLPPAPGHPTLGGSHY